MMEFTVREMDAHTATRIADWQYDPPYDFYDLAADPEDLAAFVDPENWDDIVAVEDQDGRLVGFYEFTPREATVELGLGMSPETTGNGHGAAFVSTALAYARERYDAETVTLAVATWNDRAVTVYERLGFELEEAAVRETNGTACEFYLMQSELQ